MVYLRKKWQKDDTYETQSGFDHDRLNRTVVFYATALLWWLKTEKWLWVSSVKFTFLWRLLAPAARTI